MTPPATTRPLRTVVVDDDELSRVLIEHMVGQIGELELVASCAGPLDALRVLNAEDVDLLVLDIEMPELTGLDLVRSLGRRPEIVLVTSREHYAAQAFDEEVADYIVKPVTLPRFLKSVHRILDRRRAPGVTAAAGAPLDALFVKVKSQLVRIPTSDILWVQSTGDYVTIHTQRERLIAHATLKELEARLPREAFLRVHRSYIVRLTAIRAIEDTVAIIGDELIPIGETYRPALMRSLNTL